MGRRNYRLHRQFLIRQNHPLTSGHPTFRVGLERPKGTWCGANWLEAAQRLDKTKSKATMLSTGDDLVFDRPIDDLLS